MTRDLNDSDRQFTEELRQAFANLAACETGDTVAAADVIELYSTDIVEGADGEARILELWDVLPLGRMGMRTYRQGEAPRQITYA